MAAGSWSAASLSRSTTPARPISLPAWAKATPGTAQAWIELGVVGVHDPHRDGRRHRRGRGEGAEHEHGVPVHPQARRRGGGRQLRREVLDPLE